MNRLGFRADDGIEIAAVCADLVPVRGLFRIACSDECDERGHAITETQLARYMYACAARAEGIHFRCAHANSAAHHISSDPAVT